MKRALVFPGQGSQQVGMGKELAAAFPIARMVFEEVDDALKFKLSEIIFNGPEYELMLTENAQPAIMATSMAILSVMEHEAAFRPAIYASYLAGHSLGEYTALAAGKAISLADTARLLRLRGQEMQKAVPEGKGAMAAILGLDFAKVAAVVAQAQSAGVCAIANDNAPGQVVVSGEKDAVERAVELAKEQGASRAVMLAVSAPFHCPLMFPAGIAMEEALRTAVINAPILPIVANVRASEVHEPKEIRPLLVEQVTGMVRWRESMHYLAAQGVTEVLEIGVGKVLCGLFKRTEKNIAARCIGSAADIEAFDKVA
jgi:[acyl-carrier-protein] S-malonyltransferase